MTEENDEDWKVEFLNLPSYEQIHFAQKIALDKQLREEYIKQLKARNKGFK
ncbi:hypothetical protein [Metabacillus endolithicus]|uniref:Uncharacterized protein n=1 Tax=Metabacillus endolithicus TaxID=1535204 RepID=A0ABW5BZJ2_9BACI|nr:hypothetical protein [Metabacillus endolithicus]UPG65543.1 hypothetical protein MVE64_11545 [Metabacillus endolithicus]